jgi:hypothetical protein
MTMARRVMLACGAAAALLYVVMNIVGVLQYPGYRVMSQTVSELSAIGAPSRPLWVPLGVVYDVLLIVFGIAVWSMPGARRALRVAGVLLAAQGLIGFAWAPMHVRGEGFTLTDVLHIVFAAATVLLILLTIALGGMALGRRFRLYSIATLVVTLVFGAWAGMAGPRIAANEPTPWIGLIQRVNIGAYLLWLAVLSARLVGHQRETPAAHATGALDTGSSGRIRTYNPPVNSRMLCR